MYIIKKSIIAFIFVLVILHGSNVYIKNIYYINNNGVAFTKEQYDFYTELAHEGYQEVVTQEMLEEIDWNNLEDLDVRVTHMCIKDKDVPRRDDNTYVGTSAKTLSMGNYCAPSYCRIIAELEWLGEPNIKSYDLMGSYIDGPTRLTVPSTSIFTPSGVASETTIKYDTNGFGAVIDLPDEEEIIIDQTFLYQGTGTIFISYQHAMSNITLSNSQLFNIGLIGYGNVFDFYGAAVGVYDQMPGVHMDV